MPGISRFGINQLIKHLEPLVKKGLKSVLLFGVIDTLPKVLTNFILTFLFNILPTFALTHDNHLIIFWILNRMILELWQTRQTIQ